MPTSVLEQVNDAIVAHIAAIEDPWAGGGATLFQEVFRDGDVVRRTYPLAVVTLGAETTDEGAASGRLVRRLPFDLQIAFDRTFVETTGESVKTVAATVLAEAQSALLADRTLGGVAIPGELIYLGEGSRLLVDLETRNEDGSPQSWLLNADFEVSYRTRTSDPYTKT